MNITVDSLRNQIIDMATLVEEILIQALEKDTSKEKTFELENKINEYHKIIDDDVFKYIALMAPTATDLRTALAVMKINSELERMADQAVNIKRYVLKLKEDHNQLDPIKLEVVQMVKKAISSFVEGSSKLATDVIKMDHEVNILYRENIREYFDKMRDGSTSFEEGFSAIRVSKNLERIGDLATNICEDVIFVESGKDIRHSKS